MDEPDHQELVRLISSAGVQVKNAINKMQGKAPEMEQAADRIVFQSQIILKREWIRVKKGE